MKAIFQLGEELRRARLALGIYQHTASIRVDVSRQQLSAYENGTRFMGIKTLKKLCDGYNLSFESLSRLWVQAALECGTGLRR